MATSKNEVKAKFTADTKGFSDAIKQANSTLTTLRSELKLNKAQADATGDSIDNLVDRQSILGNELQQQASKIEAMTQKLALAKAAFGDASPEVQKLETQLNNARIAQIKIQQEFDATSTAIEEMSNSSGEAVSALGRMEVELRQQETALSGLKSEYNRVAAEQGEMSAEAQELARKISQASQEVKDSRSSFQQASSAADKFDKSLDSVGDSAEDMADSLDAMDVAIGDFASDMAQNAISAISDFEESTRESRNEQNKMIAVAQQTGQSLDGLTGAYESLYGITGDSTLSSTAVLNMSAMGVSVADQQTLVNAAAGAWAAYGDSIPLDGLLESINETTRAGQVTGSFADALNWAQMSQEQWLGVITKSGPVQDAFNESIRNGMSVEDAFNNALAECTTTQERQQLVTDVMNAAYGDLGKTYQDVNADVIAANQAANDLAQAQNELAEAIAPVSTAFTELKADVLQWIVDNLPLVTSLVTGLGVAFATIMVVKNITTIVSGLSTAFTFLTSPLGLVAAAIAALVAGFMYAYQTCEPFRQAIDQLGAIIAENFAPILQTISDWFQQVAPVAMQMFNDFLVNFVVPALTSFGTFLTETVFPALQQFGDFFTTKILPALQQLGEWIVANVLPVLQQFSDFVLTNVVPAVMQFAQWVGDNVVPALGDLWNWISVNVVPALSSLWDWIVANVVPALQQFGDFVLNQVVPALQDMWKWIQDNVVPVLQNLAQFVTGTVVPALQDFWGFIERNVIPILQDLWNFIAGSVIPTLGDLGGKVMEAAGKFGEFVGKVKSAMDDALSTVQSVGGNIINFFTELPGKILNALGDIGSLLVNAGKDLINGLSRGITSAISGVVNAVKNGVSRVVDAAMGLLGIASPSKVFAEIGQFTMAGMSVGIEDNTGGVVKQVRDSMQATVAAAERTMASTDLSYQLGTSIEAKNDLTGLVSAIEALAERAINLEIDGKAFAMATASSTDRVNGSRQQFVRRGVALG